MIFLFTDFGAADIYVGQMKARLLRAVPREVAVVDLLHDAPAFNVCASAHLLAAFTSQFAPGDVCVAVVDPGVGSARDAVALCTDGVWYVGPDNGLLSVVAARVARAATFSIAWRPEAGSVSFDGRDLFAPVAARLTRGDVEGLKAKPGLDFSFGAADLAQVIYIDHYGNAMTGLRGNHVASALRLEIAGQSVAPARVFSAVAQGVAFWYVNSIGLVEIACNGAPAAARLGLNVGDAVHWPNPGSQQ